jgi:multidrug resistance protein, MATE family
LLQRSTLGTDAAGGYRELLRLALPLILSNSFWTLQVTVDRILLGQFSSNAVGAAVEAIVIFWTPFALVQGTAAYATTFVAQYLGAGRRERIGPSVWQALYFSLFVGVGFIFLTPLAETVAALSGHSPELQALEATYLACLCFAALPMLMTASVCSFFIGRGDNWSVLLINGTGLVVNAVLAWAWIFGEWGFPRSGIAGAGWATVVGSSVSALLGLTLMMRRPFRHEYATLSGWRFDRKLFGRLMAFGLPGGLQVALDVFAFALFTTFVGRIGRTELIASGVAFTLNLIAVLPTMGIGQAVGTLVGQRLGEDRPDLAERSAWTGFKVTWLFMAAVSVVYIAFPGPLLEAFHSREEADASDWSRVAELVPVLLRFVALYSLFDGINLIFSFALKGAGDTRFVTLMLLILPWPIMVLPTWMAQQYGWGLYWSWGFASTYILALALTFLLRFRGGRWKSMRVIERAPV